MSLAIDSLAQHLVPLVLIIANLFHFVRNFRNFVQRISSKRNRGECVLASHFFKSFTEPLCLLGWLILGYTTFIIWLKAGEKGATIASILQVKFFTEVLNCSLEFITLI